MKNTTPKLIITVLAACVVSACGFKSDLFIPGEPKTAQQLDSSSMEDIKKQTLDGLQDRDTEIFKTQLPELPDTDTAVPVTVETQTTIPGQGVPVVIEPLTEEEIKKIRDENKLQ